ncbi:MAG: hypothetical protein N3B18_12520 [Desulfobacterota bacterium]|nr:hypothetical protein [Thermodesulfobacteriota bacterium]
MNMQTILATLKTRMSFKATTAAGDIVLIGMPTGLFYGVIHHIEPNIKKNWYNVFFKLLVVPPVDMTWILRTPQMTGEIFTINGQEHFMIAVDTQPSQKNPSEEGKKTLKSKNRRLTLIKCENDPPPETA